MKLRIRLGVVVATVVAILGLAACVPPPPPPGAGLHTSNGQIVDDTGKVFVPVGANVGTVANFDWHGVADGQSANARDVWRWNTIRLNVVFQPLWSSTAATLSRVQGIIDEYTAKGIVVMVASHDDLPGNTLRPEVVSSFATLAANNRTNDKVWFNCVNEPDTGTTAAWVAVQKKCLSTVRGQNNPNIVVADAIDDGEDASWDVDYLRNYAPGVGGTNVVFAIHNYGSYTNVSSYRAHLDELRAKGLPVLTGETGMVLDAATSAPWQFDAVVASTGVYFSGYGVIAWHGTHGDGYYLHSDGGPFYSASPRSDFGQRLYNLTH